MYAVFAAPVRFSFAIIFLLNSLKFTDARPRVSRRSCFVLRYVGSVSANCVRFYVDSAPVSVPAILTCDDDDVAVRKCSGEYLSSGRLHVFEPYYSEGIYKSTSTFAAATRIYVFLFPNGEHRISDTKNQRVRTFGNERRIVIISSLVYHVRVPVRSVFFDRKTDGKFVPPAKIFKLSGIYRFLFVSIAVAIIFSTSIFIKKNVNNRTLHIREI